MNAIRVLRTNQFLATRATIAQSWRARMVGLLGRPGLAEGDGLVFPRCQGIHTIGMRFPIDAVFVDRTWRVVALRPYLTPGRLGVWVWKAWGVIELPQGAIARTPVLVGDQLEISPAMR